MELGEVARAGRGAKRVRAVLNRYDQRTVIAWNREVRGLDGVGGQLLEDGERDRVAPAPEPRWSRSIAQAFASPTAMASG